MLVEIATPRGTATANMLWPPSATAASLLVLGHGAGGDVTAPDLVAVARAVHPAGVITALVTQPYRVAGRRAPAPAGYLDEAWLAVLERLRAPERPADPAEPAGSAGPADTADPAGAGSRAGRAGAGRPGGVALVGTGLPLIVGGRSSGARVACRTARAAGAAGVVALAFPTHPPGKPGRSRAGELRTGLPTLVVNGDRDPFGVPPPLPEVEVLIRPGERHDLRGDPAAVARHVVGWLRGHGWAY